MWSPLETEQQDYLTELKTAYTHRSEETVLRQLRAEGATEYDALIQMALQEPMTWEVDVKQWIKKWQHQGWVIIEGLKPGGLVPKLEQHHIIRWIGAQRDTLA